ncbi:Hypothetical predicted protein, partial [Pelobates cultripes]
CCSDIHGSKATINNILESANSHRFGNISMSQRSAENTDSRERHAFFAANTAHIKLTSHAAQDGDKDREDHDQSRLQSPAEQHSITGDMIQQMLDTMAEKLQKAIHEATSDIKKD